MKMNRFFASLAALGLMASTSGFAQTTQVPIYQGYIRQNGVNYVVRGNVAYAVTGDITQYITPAAAQTLREGYMLLPTGALTPAPAGLNYSSSAPPQSTVEAERVNATRPVSGENTSGLAPAMVPATNNTAVTGNGTTAAGNLNTNATTSGNGTVNTQASTNGQVVPPGMSGAVNPVRTNGTNGGVVVPGSGQIQANQDLNQQSQIQNRPLNQAQVPGQNQTAVNPVQQNGTRAQVPVGTQQNGTQPRVTNGAQPNGSAAPVNNAGGAAGAR